MAARRNNNTLNETLAGIWQELLGAEPERAPDFTRAGGSSMDALDLQLQVAARLGKHLAFDALPDPLTFVDLVRAVESAPPAAAPGAEVSPTEAPATETQRAQWLIERAGSGTSAYTVPILLRLGDGTTMNALGAAIARLVELHPSLRTSIGLAGDDEDRLLQRVHPAGALFPLETRALGSFEASDVEALLAAMLEPLPSIVRPSPMRATALTINGELRGAMLLIHHAAIDEWSIRVLLEDLDLLLRGESPSPERLALAAASEPAITNEDRAWWGEVLESIPPHAEFPSDHGDAVRRIIRRTIDAESVARLDSTCAARGVEAAPAIIQAVAASVALHVADSSGVVSIGVPMSLRNDARLDRTLGMFLNTVPIPVMTSDPDFDGAVQRTRQLMLEARRRRFVPFGSIARDHGPRRTDGRTPWLDVMVGVVDRPLPATQAFDAEVLEMHDSAAPLLIITRRCSDGSIDVVVHHQTERVGSTVAESIIDGALARLDAFGRDASTTLATSITDSAETPEPETLVAIVERQAAANRDAIAVQSSDRILSYGEIVSLGRKVAAALDAAGARPGDAIAIELESSWEFPVAVLGVLQAGCAALPIDPDTPSARRNELRTLAGAHRSIDAAFVHAAESRPECDELPLIALESRCYLLFTSGSTGEPKGVQMHHGPIANLVAFEVRRNPLPLPTAMLAPLGFDVVFQEIFGTWARGGILIPVPSATRKDPHALANFIEGNSIGRVHSPPILLRLLSRVIAPKDSRLASLEEVISAGEALHIDDGFRAMARAAGGFALVNQYGPTETHVATSIDLGMDPSAWPERPSVGTPIDGVRVRVAGKEGDEVARGFEGELQIGGRGPALGYLHDDPAHRFTIEEDGRWYSTGDRARILGDGSIEYLGRRDDQVKVAGYRVELGEVEHALAALDGIAAAAVVAASVDGETVLRAFVILEQNHSFDHAAIDAALRLRLPSYLRPRTIDVRDRFPLSANGKVNRKRLRESLEAIAEAIATPPTGDTKVAQLVATALNRLIDRQADDLQAPMVTLGLDSLGSIRLQMEIERAFGVVVPVADLMGMSVAEISARVEATTASPPKTERAHLPSVSHEARDLDALERDLVSQVAAAPSGAFHLAWRIDFDAPVDPEVLQWALGRLRARHPSLRTARSAANGAQVFASGDLPSPRVERIEARPDEAALGGMLRHPLDLERGECFRAVLWPRGEGTTVLLVAHHAAIDGRGAEALIAELLRDLDAVHDDGNRAQGSTETSDVVLRGFEEEVTDVAWWVSHINEVMGDELPQTPRRTGNEATTEVRKLAKGADLLAIAGLYSRALGSTPIAIVLGTWAIMVGRLVGRDRVLLGVPFAVDPSSEGSIRLGASMLPIAVDVSGDRPLESVVRDVAAVLLHGIDHRHASFGSIARAFGAQRPKKKSLGRTPIDAVLTVDVGARRLGGAVVQWEPTGVSPFQAALVIEEGAAPAIGVQLEAGLLGGESMEDFTDRFEVVLEAVLAGLDATHPSGSKVGDLPLATVHQNRTLCSFESGGEALTTPHSLGRQFELTAAEQPDAPAVRCASSVLSYADLERWSRTIAASLLEQGLLVGDRVAFPGVRGAAAIATMIGIARAGGVYVPIDPVLPVDRQAQQLQEASVRMAIGFDAALQVERALALPPCDAEPRPIAAPTLAADAGLYVMFTSGTTGVPKGSLISHHAVGRLVDDQPFSSSARPLSMLHAAPLAFDASTLEIWGPLLTGGTISCWEGDGADLVGISDRIARDNVTAAWLTSSLFQAAVDGVPTLFDPLEIVLTGGDVVSAEHVRRLQERKPELVIINGYGPTENTVFTTCEVIGPGMKRGISQLSIGRPIRGTTVRIVDETGVRAPKGRVGELLAGGWGVAMPSDGSDRDGQFMVLDGERWYRTGDRARWCADGRLEFHGRVDGQVKIGGHRVEFTAVEAALRRCPGVTDACVTTIGEGARRRLVAAVAGNEAMVTAAVARQFARGVLSPAEVPSTIVAVAVIPATENGKADRRAVAALVGRAPEVALTSGRDDELLSIVLDVVKGCLGRELASTEQPLSEAGIDSIDLVRISLALGERLARPVELGDVLEGGSAEGISDRLRVEMAREAERLVVLRQTEEGSGPSLYCVPGVGGTVFSFGALLDSIDANIGVFGLPYPGVAGPEAPLDTVDTLAARCAARIAEGRPADVIVGYSLGGFVAFETARLVLEQTGVAPEVAVIDSAPAALPLWKGEGASRSLRRELKLRLEAVLPPGVVAMMRGRGKAVTLEAMRRVVAAGFKAFNRYDPSSAPLDVTLLRTTRTDFDSAGAIADLGWSHLAARTRVVEIEGTHLEVFRGTTALEIGRALSARCAYAGRLDQRPRRAFRKSSGD